ncbi:DUF120 domain-containing protein [Pyrolobus fumarii]|uniref:DUF120 domain-containing protein n=1 Tax=Pyrolobus fumarii TaxID=54252 RepID=UPI0014331F06
MTRGVGKASRFVTENLYKRLFLDILGCEPYPGTLNVQISDELVVRAYKTIIEELGPCMIYTPRDTRYGRIHLLEALVYGIIPGIIVIPERGVHDYSRTLEIVACRRIRDIAESLNSLVYVVVGCGLIRCWYFWSRAILSLKSSGL